MLQSLRASENWRESGSIGIRSSEFGQSENQPGFGTRSSVGQKIILETSRQSDNKLHKQRDIQSTLTLREHLHSKPYPPQITLIHSTLLITPVGE